MISPYKTKLSAPLSVRALHTPGAGSACTRARKSSGRGGKMDLHLVWSAFGYLEQDSAWQTDRQTNKLNQPQQHWAAPGARCFGETRRWGRFVFSSQRLGGNTRSPCCYQKGFTEDGGRCKCGGDNSVVFPPSLGPSIVLSAFCWLFVPGDMAEQSYSWWVSEWVRSQSVALMAMLPQAFLHKKKGVFWCLFSQSFFPPSTLIACARIYFHLTHLGVVMSTKTLYMRDFIHRYTEGRCTNNDWGSRLKRVWMFLIRLLLLWLYFCRSSVWRAGNIYSSSNNNNNLIINDDDDDNG